MTTGSEGGEGGGFGGAADLLGGAAPAPAGGAAAGAAAGAGAEAGAGAGAGGEGGGAALAADPDWYVNISTDADGESASNRDWVKSRGAKTIDDLVKGFRDTQRALHDKNAGLIKVPGEGATPEEITAFRTAIGVPENVDGYTLPEVRNGKGELVPLDNSLLGKLLPKALERGLPAEAMNGLIADYVALQLDDVAQFDNDTRAGAQAWLGRQGSEANAKMAAIDQAGRALGFDKQDMVAIRNAMAAASIEKGGSAADGVGKVLDAFTKLGQGMAEDTMITGGKGRFGITGREAQAELDQIKSQVGTDKEFARKVNTAGTAENARYRRLLDMAASYAVEQSRSSV